MGKPGLGLFTGRRKSSSNVLEEMTADTAPGPDGYGSANADSGGFRLMSRTEVEKANERRKTMEREKSSKFPRFSGFGTNGSKGRIQSFEEESPGSSKRDSKSSNGTQFSSSRPYNNPQHGSTSTLPSSTDTSSDDNIFASAPRPHISQHNSSPSSSLPMNGFRKQLPSLPKSSSGVSYKDSEKHARDRSMTSSSYASTAIPPKLEADLNFGNSDFEDMFSDLKRKESAPEMSREVAGRSLLSEKRTFQAEPIRINPALDVEAPLKSWESRGSADNLMSSPHSDNDSPPPPPPPHKYSQYAPVASESPTLSSSATFADSNAHLVRKPFVDRTSYYDSSHEQHPEVVSTTSSSTTPASSTRSSNHTTNATPKASLASTTSLYTDYDGENMFTPTKVQPKPTPAPAPAPRSTLPMVVEDRPTPASTSAPKGLNGRVLTQTEYLAMQKRANSQPPPEDDSDDEDYEDEEDAIKKREEEEIMRRKQQQMRFAREAMRRTTTAPADPGHHEGGAVGLGMGFPSETSMKADEWEDEDVPLGILAQHGFPSQARNRVPTQPANAMPNYLPDRPASAGALHTGALPGHLPAFARHLPADPHSSFIGGGLVRSSNRESMGFNGMPRGPASIAGDSIAGGMGMGGMGMPASMMYQDAGMSQPSLVDQIQMRDMTKQKYMGGASNKKPQGGPFTGMLGQQMNANGQPQNPTRMPQMPQMNGMNTMMNPMMGGQMPMMGMSMNQMGYPMGQGNDMMAMQQMQQMQQMIAMQQFQLQQMQAMQQPGQQDPRMSMAMPNNSFGGNMMGNGSFLNVPGAVPNGMAGRPMSFVSVNGGQRQQPPMSNYMGPGPGYTPSIAPSERSNIGLSARYRPVVSNTDAHSTGTSMTLQASGGANQTIKGTIKQVRKVPTEEDEDWSRMAARKNKFSSNKQQSNGLAELTKGLNI